MRRHSSCPHQAISLPDSESFLSSATTSRSMDGSASAHFAVELPSALTCTFSCWTDDKRSSHRSGLSKSSRVSRWSATPFQSCVENICSLTAPRHPCFSVHKEQTRFPLSTEEMKRGLTASNVRVSYQL